MTDLSPIEVAYAKIVEAIAVYGDTLPGRPDYDPDQLRAIFFDQVNAIVELRLGQLFFRDEEFEKVDMYGCMAFDLLSRLLILNRGNELAQEIIFAPKSMPVWAKEYVTFREKHFFDPGFGVYSAQNGGANVDNILYKGSHCDRTDVAVQYRLQNGNHFSTLVKCVIDFMPHAIDKYLSTAGLQDDDL